MADNSTKFDLKAFIKNPTFQKVFSIVKTVLFWIIIAIAVFMMVFTIISVNMFDQDDRNIFGYRMLIVKSDSMKATDFAAGDLIIVKEVDVREIKEGDIISFISEGSENKGEVVTHKVAERIPDGEGGIAFKTYGTTSGDIDDTPARIILGRYEGVKFPKMGTFFNFMKTTEGYIVCILVPFMILILWQGANSVLLFLKYRKEQNAEAEARRAEMEEERRKLEQEKVETQKMMEEIMKLKAQLEAKDKSSENQSTDQGESV